MSEVAKFRILVKIWYEGSSSPLKIYLGKNYDRLDVDQNYEWQVEG